MNTELFWVGVFFNGGAVHLRRDAKGGAWTMEVVAVDNSDLAADASRLLVYHPKSRSGNHFSLVDGGAILLNATNGGGYFPTRTNAQAIKLTPYVRCNQRSEQSHGESKS